MSLNPQKETNLKRVNNFLGSNILKFAGSVILAIYFAGVWVERMDNLPKEIASELIKQIDDIKNKQSSHELSDKYEKQIINNSIDNLMVMINDVKDDINTPRQKAEFIRPTTPELPEPESRMFKKKVR